VALAEDLPSAQAKGETCQALALHGSFLVAAFASGRKRGPHLDRIAVFKIDRSCHNAVAFCGHLPHVNCLDRGVVRVNKISLDLERRGKIILACSSKGSTIDGQ
jgi:hypothetical protein